MQIASGNVFLRTEQNRLFEEQIKWVLLQFFRGNSRHNTAWDVQSAVHTGSKLTKVWEQSCPWLSLILLGDVRPRCEKSVLTSQEACVWLGRCLGIAWYSVGTQHLLVDWLNKSRISFLLSFSFHFQIVPHTGTRLNHYFWLHQSQKLYWCPHCQLGWNLYFSG